MSYLEIFLPGYSVGVKRNDAAATFGCYIYDVQTNEVVGLTNCHILSAALPTDSPLRIVINDNR